MGVENERVNILLKIREMYQKHTEVTNNIYLVMNALVYLFYGSQKLGGFSYEYLIRGISIGNPVSWLGLVLSVSWILNVRRNRAKSGEGVVGEIERRVLEMEDLEGFKTKRKRSKWLLLREWVPILFLILYVSTIPLVSPRVWNEYEEVRKKDSKKEKKKEFKKKENEHGKNEEGVEKR